MPNYSMNCIIIMSTILNMLVFMHTFTTLHMINQISISADQSKNDEKREKQGTGAVLHPGK